MPRMWGAMTYPHIRSLRKLHLDGDDRLDAFQLAAMTALESLHASTPAVYAAVTDALPALTRLTRLELMASRDHNLRSGRFAVGAACTAQLAVLLRQLSALPSLRHLSVGGPACKGAQTLDGETVLPPALEVLHLNSYVELEANNELLAFLSFKQPSRLSAMRIADLSLGADHNTVSDFRAAMTQTVPAYVSVTVHRFFERSYDPRRMAIRSALGLAH